MPKKDIGFRFTEEAHATLIELAREQGKTRTQVLEELILGAVRPGQVIPVPPESFDEIIKTKDPRTPEQKRDDFYRANMAKGKK